MRDHYFPLLFRFLWVYIAALVGIGALSAAIGISSTGTSMVPIMLAAMDGGGRFVKRALRAPTSGEKWVLAIVHSTVAMLLAIPVLIVLVAYVPDVSEFLPAEAMLLILGIALVVNLLICRVFIWIGARSMVKKLGPELGTADPSVFQ